MADTGRQSTTEKAQQALKPESQKTTTEQMKDKAKEMYESAAAKVQPESEKSHYQQMADKLSGDSTGGWTGSQTKGTLGTGGQNTFGTSGGEGQQ